MASPRKAPTALAMSLLLLLAAASGAQGRALSASSADAGDDDNVPSMAALKAEVAEAKASLANSNGRRLAQQGGGRTADSAADFASLKSEVDDFKGEVAASAGRRRALLGAAVAHVSDAVANGDANDTDLASVQSAVTDFKGELGASDSGFSCDGGATYDGGAYCNVLQSIDGRIKSVLVADGFVFVMKSDGVMLRCDQAKPNSCTKFNALKSDCYKTDTCGGPMIYLRQGFIIATSGNDMVVCSTTSADSCTLINQCAYNTIYTSLLLANNRIYAGLSSGTMWSCDATPQPNSCDRLNKAGSAIYSLAYGDGVLWAGLDSGTMWKCDPNTPDSCVRYNKAGSGITSLLLTNGVLLAGLSSGIIWKCPLDRSDACDRLNKFGSRYALSAPLIQLPNDASTIYVGTDDSVYRCPVATPDSCTTVATTSRGQMEYFSVAKDDTFYAVYVELVAAPYDYKSWVSWVGTPGGAEPAPKRPRREPGADPTAGVIAPGLLDEGGRAALRAAHDGAAPYTHLVLRGLADEGLLRRVRDEVISNVAATYKETDLFKVFQTGDLANLDSLDPESAAKLPNLLALRDAIYSPTFRKCAASCRRCREQLPGACCAVSFIIYLTDPDDPWTAADGGALELYPLVEGKPHTPDVTPTTSLLPHWNSMALFVVQPGRSFHSVQEVVSADKPRFSISGWYHKAAPQAGAQHASLQQLQMRAGEDALQGHVGAAMEADGSVQLQRFLAADVAAQIAAATAAADAAQGVGSGAIPPFDAACGDGWEAEGPPHKQRYLRYAGAPRTPDAAAAANGGGDGGAAKAANGAAGTAGPGALLAGVRSELFESGAFARLLRAMLGVDVLRHAGEVRRFRAGLDYTVAHYGIITSAPRLDCVLSFVDDAGGRGAAQGWAVGEVRRGRSRARRERSARPAVTTSRGATLAAALRSSPHPLAARAGGRL
ncbi:Ogd [Scenedesmus sp. PABB004]|nr:Ogd [Scenedesmus sp. PABB004]